MADKNNEKRNDWLAEELDRENRRSAWDLDETSKQKRRFKTKHPVITPIDPEDEAKKKDVKAEICLDILLVLAFGFAYLNLYLNNKQWWPTVFMILMVHPGIFIWLLIKKDIPAWYFILVIIVGCALEFLVVFRGWTLSW